MKKSITLFGLIGLLIGVYFSVMSILLRLSEERGYCPECPVDFWKKITTDEIYISIVLCFGGIILGGVIGFLIYKLFKKITFCNNGYK